MQKIIVILLILLLTIVLTNNTTKSVFNYQKNDISNIQFMGSNNILIKNSLNNIVYSLKKEDKLEIQDNYIYINDINKKIIFNEIMIYKKDLIYIVNNSYKLCIYNNKNKEITKANLFEGCNFIYLYNCHKNFYFKLNREIAAIFYNNKIKFSNKFLEEIYLNWIDIFAINDDEITIINTATDYSIIQAPKNRRKN